MARYQQRRKREKRQKRQMGAVTLTRRRIYIIPSWHGIIFSLFLLVMLLGAMNYSNSVAFLLTFLLTSVALVSMLHTYRNMAQLVIQVGKATPVFAGQAVQFSIALNNPAGWGRYALGVQFNQPDCQEQWLDLAVGQTQWLMVSTNHQTTRGWFLMPELRVFTRYPLGLFYAWSRIWLVSQCLVYPKPIGVALVPTVSPYHATELGDKGYGTDDFIGFRPYHPGDSPRHVNWKAVAREQALLTKQFGGDRVEEVWLDWDRLPHHATEARLSQLTQWVLTVAAQPVLYGLKLPGVVLEPNQGGAHQQHCLRALALYGKQTDDPAV